MCAAVQEAIFLRQLKQDMFITQIKTTPIAEDNQNCIKLPSYPVFPNKSKHMSTKLHCVREKWKMEVWKYSINQLKKWQQIFSRKHWGDCNLTNNVTTYLEVAQACPMKKIPERSERGCFRSRPKSNQKQA